MGFNVIKRVADLRKQVDQSQTGRWKPFRTTFLSLIAISIVALIIFPKFQTEKPLDVAQRLKKQYQEQLQWLEESPFVLVPGAASKFESIGKSLVTSLAKREKEAEEVDQEDNILTTISIDTHKVWLRSVFYGMFLRAIFVLIPFWPVWIIVAVAAYFLARRKRTTTKRDTMLSVLDRKRSPFYSGVYGPLRPNGSFSGTDLSTPSLACPQLAPLKTTQEHRLVQLLKSFGALNDTTMELARVILAHRDFPAAVGEENPIQEEEKDVPDEDEDIYSQKGYITSANGFDLEKSSIEGLTAVLEAHRRMNHYRESLEQKKIKTAALNKSYPSHAANIQKLCAGLSPLGALLTRTLTPNRMWALAQLPPSIIATTYLAIEAGKVLVYKRHGEGFTKISNYPHLQARAIVMSIPSFHKEYNGDARLIIRQAIICSRRHGDLGRSFLPIRMPLESRALRDWLEILYADTDKRVSASDLVELDAHMDEIGINWKQGFSNQIKQFKKNSQPPELREQAKLRGLPFKSVILVPVEQVVHIALKGIHPARKQRVAELLDLTRSYQTKLSISARLPGFKRQAMEAEKSGDDSDSILQSIAERNSGNTLINDWRVVRRMLTRHNWLSTRVGDDAVPLVGLVQGVVNLDPSANRSSNQGVRFDNLVPLRQRRFVELFGKNWELLHFCGAPNPETIEVFTSSESLEEALKRADQEVSAQERQETTDSEVPELGEVKPNDRSVASG